MTASQASAAETISENRCTELRKKRRVINLKGFSPLMKVFQFKANDFKMLASNITGIIRHHNFIF